MRKFVASRRLEYPFDQLGGGQLFMSRAVIAPVAAKFSTIQLINPVGSLLYIVVHKVRGFLATAGRVQFSIHNAAITTSLLVQCMRPASTVSAMGQANKDTIAALDVALMESDAALTMGDLTPFSPLWFLDEGKGLAVEVETANIGATLEIYWSELWQ